MKKPTALLLFSAMILGTAFSQTPQKPAQQEVAPDDIVRITTNLVQTDVVITDKDDQIIKDLKLEDFELSDNGKKQDLKFMEFVSVDTGRRLEGKKPGQVVGVEGAESKGVTAKELKRVMAFVVDDLTIPYQDLNAVRSMLLDFVNNKMTDGDLVAIVRVVGGKGLLQQFTSDRQLLRRAIAAIKPIAHPFAVSNTPEPGRIDNPRAPGVSTDVPSSELVDTPEIFSPNDDANQVFRGLAALSTANYLIESLKEIPGRKNLVILSGGIPIFEVRAKGTDYASFTYLLEALKDHAFRAGVVINTLDPRGLNATPGVVSYTMTPGRSAIDVRGPDPTFGRGSAEVFGPLLAGGAERLGLSTVAKATGGVSVANTNDFVAGLEKIVNRNSGYYTLAYTPGENFDGKFHKIDVKVRRSGAKVFHHSGYTAKADQPRTLGTKEEQIAAAAISPLARRDIDVTPNVAVKLLPENKATIDIHFLIDATKLNFSETGGKYRTSLDIVGFVFDQVGRQRGGFSETINLDLPKADYVRAQTEGLVYSANTELQPGNYQIRAVVRESSSGSLGTFSKYVEIPDLTKDRLAMSSVFLFAVDSAATPTPLLASRRLTRNQDLRYVAIIYNPRLKSGKPQLHSQMIISQGGNVLFREPEQRIEANGNAPVTKMGQLGLSKVPPGRYVLTLVVTDMLADKKLQTVSHSIDFVVAN